MIFEKAWFSIFKINFLIPQLRGETGRLQALLDKQEADRQAKDRAGKDSQRKVS